MLPLFFFFNNRATPELSPLPPHDALPTFNVSVPLPNCTRAPVPPIAPPKVTESLRSNAKVPLSVIFPEMLPLVPPLPISSVPAPNLLPPDQILFPLHLTILLPHSTTPPVPP